VQKRLAWQAAAIDGRFNLVNGVSLKNLASLTGASSWQRVPHEKTASARGMKRLSP
jgi:hypothetical protein